MRRALPAALVLAMALTRPIAAETIDRVLAVVGGQVITLSDLTAARDLHLVGAPDSPDAGGDLLQRLIDRQLVLQEVDRYAPPEPSDQDVARELARVRGRFQDPAAFSAALARSGMDERQLRQVVRDDLRIAAYLDLRFVVAPASEEELGRYYREHTNEFTREGRVLPLAAVSTDIAAILAAERRRMLIDDWVAGLRRRAAITKVYAAVQ